MSAVQGISSGDEEEEDLPREESTRNPLFDSSPSPLSGNVSGLVRSACLKLPSAPWAAGCQLAVQECLQAVGVTCKA